MPRHPLKVSAATRRPDVSAATPAQLSSFLCSSQESSSVASATRKGFSTRKTSRDWIPVTSTGMRETGVAPSPHRLLRASLLRSAVDVDGDIFGWDAEGNLSAESVVRIFPPQRPPSVSVATHAQLSSFLCLSQEPSSVVSATRKSLSTRKTSRDWIPVTSTGMRETGVPGMRYGRDLPHRLSRPTLTAPSSRHRSRDASP